LVIERHVNGGQAGASSLIRNYLGFPRGISGSELTQRAYQQAWLFGAKFVFSRSVTSLCSRGTKKILKLSDGRENRSDRRAHCDRRQVQEPRCPRLATLYWRECLLYDIWRDAIRA